MNQDEYLQCGGGRFGNGSLFSLNATRPFVKIIINRESVRLQISFPLLNRDYMIRRQEVTDIKEYRGFFSKGIQIFHSNDELPNFIVFWPSDLPTLLKAINKFGYPIVSGE